MSWVAIGIGAALGAWLRWGLAIWLQGWHNQLAFGTLAANLGGGYMIGMALAFFQNNPALPPEWRFFLITGFLGGLTTFSTFTGESMTLLQNGDYLWALIHALIHVVGSLLLCIAGYASIKALLG